MWIREIILGIIGISAGFTVAGGFVALITLLGVIPKLASATKTASQAITYENALIVGIIFWNIVYLYQIPLPFGNVLMAFFGIFSGVFVGAMAVALAEIINTFPIFFRRISLRKGAPCLVYSLAIGKGIGAILQVYWR